MGAIEGICVLGRGKMGDAQSSAEGCCFENIEVLHNTSASAAASFKQPGKFLIYILSPNVYIYMYIRFWVKLKRRRRQDFINNTVVMGER